MARATHEETAFVGETSAIVMSCALRLVFVLQRNRISGSEVLAPFSFQFREV